FFCDRCCLTYRVGKQSKLTDQRPRTYGNLTALCKRAGFKQQRTFLYDISAIGKLASVEEHRPTLQMTRLGADRQNAQGLLPERRQVLHLLKKSDVFLEAHAAYPQPFPETGKWRTGVRVCAFAAPPNGTLIRP